MTRSEQLFERAVKRIPGGVNSPVRSYGAIGEAPRFIEKADKSHPYSDQKISDLLAAEGTNVSKRLVTRYRTAMQIPAMSGRRFYEK